MRESGRFSKVDDPSPVFKYRGLSCDLLNPDRKRRTGLAKFLQRWKRVAVPFEKTPLYMELLEWNGNMVPKKPMETRLLEAERDSSIPRPPHDFKEMKQARLNHEREWRIPHATLASIKSFAGEFRSRKRFLVYEFLNSATKLQGEVEISKSTSSIYFHIGGTNRVVRLGDHKPSFSDPRLKTLEISYTEPMGAIRQKIETFLSK